MLEAAGLTGVMSHGLPKLLVWETARSSVMLMLCTLGQIAGPEFIHCQTMRNERSAENAALLEKKKSSGHSKGTMA